MTLRSQLIEHLKFSQKFAFPFDLKAKFVDSLTSCD